MYYNNNVYPLELGYYLYQLFLSTRSWSSCSCFNALHSCFARSSFTPLMVGSICFNMFEIFDNTGIAVLLFTFDLPLTKLSSSYSIQQKIFLSVLIF